MLSPTPQCPTHGPNLRRDRRRRRPAHELWDRARKRALRLSLAFNLPQDAIVIPPACPVLGLPLKAGGKRSEQSPSLDRIRPQDGYVVGNIRVVSDRANRLKGALDLPRLEARTAVARGARRQEYECLVEYVRRERSRQLDRLTQNIPLQLNGLTRKISCAAVPAGLCSSRRRRRSPARREWSRRVTLT